MAASLGVDGAVLHYEVLRDPGYSIWEQELPGGLWAGGEEFAPAELELAVPAEAVAVVLFRPVLDGGRIALMKIGEVSGW